jgi:hypothetical protein
LRLFIVRASPSDGANDLARALREAGVDCIKMRRPPRGDRPNYGIIWWGESPDRPRNQPQLNAVETFSKYEEVYRLTEAGVPTVTACDSGSCAEPHLRRAYSHHGGLDLINPHLVRSGFEVHREDIAREFRIHVWNGVSARAGIKVPSPTAHPWIRSHYVGWNLDYGTACQEIVRQKHRDVAKAATTALGYDFAAVDVAERSDGTVFTLEVNRAPGLENNTTLKYRDKVLEWMRTW